MIQFNSVQDALYSLLNEYGLSLLDNPCRTIALLSDYIPELAVQQRHIRCYLRSGGSSCLLTIIRNKLDRLDALTLLYEEGIKADVEFDALLFSVQCFDGLARQYNNNYDALVTSECLYETGMQFFRKTPREKFMPIAITLLCEAGEKGSAEAYLRVANCYLKGKGIESDIVKGIHYLELASSAGSPGAVLELAERSFRGDGVDKDPQKAVDLLRGIDSFPGAGLLLGEIHISLGEMEKGFSAFATAARGNDIQAQYELALCYAMGRGVKRNIQDAMIWLKSAAQLGHSEARKKLEELGETWV